MSGNIDTRTEIIPASGVVNLGNANFLFVISSTAAVSFKMKRLGLGRGANQENYSGLTSGLQVARTQRWDQCDITGAAGVSVTFMYGYTDIREDVTLFNQQIAVISGVTAIANQPAGTVVDRAGILTVAGTHAFFAANLARRRITVFADPANANTVSVLPTGGANIVGLIQPGQFVQFEGTYGLDYNDAVGGNTFRFFEES